MREETRIYALGFFDGVHLGHQALLNACRDLAQQLGCGTAAITFDAHPKSLFSEDLPGLISTTHDREFLLRFYGIEHIGVFGESVNVPLIPITAIMFTVLDVIKGVVLRNDFPATIGEPIQCFLIALFVALSIVFDSYLT